MQACIKAVGLWPSAEFTTLGRHNTKAKNKDTILQIAPNHITEAKISSVPSNTIGFHFLFNPNISFLSQLYYVYTPCLEKCNNYFMYLNICYPFS